MNVFNYRAIRHGVLYLKSEPLDV